MNMVDLATFAAAQADGALVLDVREPMEYVSGHVPGAHLVPLGHLGEVITQLTKGSPVYVICQSGSRSMTGAAMLARAGFDARPVAGGTSGWVSSGRPVVRGQVRR